MKRLRQILGSTSVMIFGLTSVAYADSPVFPCVESECAASCQQIATNFGTPGGQPSKPPETGFARCLNVSVQEGGDDGCDYVDHVVCDCDGSPPQPGVTEHISGMPLFGMKADAPDGTCVREGNLPHSCLMRGSDVRCKVDGDGSDCKAACDLLRTRIDAELPRSQMVTVDGSQCAASEVCACIVQFEGQCSLLTTQGIVDATCGTPPKQAWTQWSENWDPPSLCTADSCNCRMVGPSPLPVMAPLSFISMVTLGMLRRKRRNQYKATR